MLRARFACHCARPARPRPEGPPRRSRCVTASTDSAHCPLPELWWAKGPTSWGEGASKAPKKFVLRCGLVPLQGKGSHQHLHPTAEGGGRGGGGAVDRGVATAKTVKRPRQQPAQPSIRQLLGAAGRANGPSRHIQHSPNTPNHWALRTRKRHQQEHRPQRPTDRSDPTQHAKGRTGDCQGPRKGATTRRNVTQGVRLVGDWTTGEALCHIDKD